VARNHVIVIIAGKSTPLGAQALSADLGIQPTLSYKTNRVTLD